MHLHLYIIAKQLCLLHAERSHCLVEWDEEGNPLTVVLYSAVSCRKGENDVQVGDECIVTVKEGTKKVDYKVKLAGIGKCHSKYV